MNEIVGNLQLVINTLQELDIKSTYDNLNRLLGSIQVLDRIKQTIINSETNPEFVSEPEPAEDIPVEVEEVGNEHDK